MSIFKIFAFTCSIATIFIVSFNGAVFADDKLVKIDQDENGVPVFIKLEREPGINYQILQQSGSGMSEISVRVNCGEARMYIKKIALYNSQGYKIAEDKQRTEMKPSPNSIAFKSMQFFCRSIDAFGW